MIRLLRCWGVALFLGAIGLGITAGLVPDVPPGRQLSEFDRTLHILLPWIIVTLLMTVVAGALYRDRADPGRRLAGILLVPLLMTLGMAATGFPAAAGHTAAMMYLVAGVLGSALGLNLANLMSEKEHFSGYW
jgi:hypothetical protein